MQSSFERRPLDTRLSRARSPIHAKRAPITASAPKGYAVPQTRSFSRPLERQHSAGSSPAPLTTTPRAAHSNVTASRVRRDGGEQAGSAVRSGSAAVRTPRSGALTGPASGRATAVKPSSERRSTTPRRAPSSAPMHMPAQSATTSARSSVAGRRQASVVRRTGTESPAPPQRAGLLHGAGALLSAGELHPLHAHSPASAQGYAAAEAPVSSSAEDSFIRDARSESKRDGSAFLPDTSQSDTDSVTERALAEAAARKRQAAVSEQPIVTEEWTRTMIRPEDEHLLYARRTRSTASAYGRSTAVPPGRDTQRTISLQRSQTASLASSQDAIRRGPEVAARRARDGTATQPSARVRGLAADEGLPPRPRGSDSLAAHADASSSTQVFEEAARRRQSARLIASRVAVQQYAQAGNGVTRTYHCSGAGGGYVTMSDARGSELARHAPSNSRDRRTTPSYLSLSPALSSAGRHSAADPFLSARQSAALSPTVGRASEPAGRGPHAGVDGRAVGTVVSARSPSSAMRPRDSPGQPPAVSPARVGDEFVRVVTPRTVGAADAARCSPSPRPISPQTSSSMHLAPSIADGLSAASTRGGLGEASGSLPWGAAHARSRAESGGGSSSGGGAVASRSDVRMTVAAVNERAMRRRRTPMLFYRPTTQMLFPLSGSTSPARPDSEAELGRPSAVNEVASRRTSGVQLRRAPAVATSTDLQLSSHPRGPSRSPSPAAAAGDYELLVSIRTRMLAQLADAKGGAGGGRVSTEVYPSFPSETRQSERAFAAGRTDGLPPGRPSSGEPRLSVSHRRRPDIGVAVGALKAVDEVDRTTRAAQEQRALAAIPAVADTSRATATPSPPPVAAQALMASSDGTTSDPSADATEQLRLLADPLYPLTSEENYARLVLQNAEYLARKQLKDRRALLNYYAVSAAASPLPPSLFSSPGDENTYLAVPRQESDSGVSHPPGRTAADGADGVAVESAQMPCASLPQESLEVPTPPPRSPGLGPSSACPETAPRSPDGAAAATGEQAQPTVVPPTATGVSASPPPSPPPPQDPFRSSDAAVAQSTAAPSATLPERLHRDEATLRYGASPPCAAISPPTQPLALDEKGSPAAAAAATAASFSAASSQTLVSPSRERAEALLATPKRFSLGGSNPTHDGALRVPSSTVTPPPQGRRHSLLGATPPSPPTANAALLSGVALLSPGSSNSTLTAAEGGSRGASCSGTLLVNAVMPSPKSGAILPLSTSSMGYTGAAILPTGGGVAGALNSPSVSPSRASSTSTSRTGSLVPTGLSQQLLLKQQQQLQPVGSLSSSASSLPAAAARPAEEEEEVSPPPPAASSSSAADDGAAEARVLQSMHSFFPAVAKWRDGAFGGVPAHSVERTAPARRLTAEKNLRGRSRSRGGAGAGAGAFARHPHSAVSVTPSSSASSSARQSLNTTLSGAVRAEEELREFVCQYRHQLQDAGLLTLSPGGHAGGAEAMSAPTTGKWKKTFAGPFMAALRRDLWLDDPTAQPIPTEELDGAQGRAEDAAVNGAGGTPAPAWGSAHAADGKAADDDTDDGEEEDVTVDLDDGSSHRHNVLFTLRLFSAAMRSSTALLPVVSVFERSSGSGAPGAASAAVSFPYFSPRMPPPAATGATGSGRDAEADPYGILSAFSVHAVADTREEASQWMNDRVRATELLFSTVVSPPDESPFTEDANGEV